MEKDLLDTLFEDLPTEILNELERERGEDAPDIPASVFAEARKLLESRGYNSCPDPILTAIFDIIPFKVKDIIKNGRPTAAHFTEARRLLESPLYYELRSRTKIKATSNMADILQFDEHSGAVISAAS